MKDLKTVLFTQLDIARNHEATCAYDVAKTYSYGEYEHRQARREYAYWQHCSDALYAVIREADLEDAYDEWRKAHGEEI